MFLTITAYQARTLNQHFDKTAYADSYRIEPAEPQTARNASLRRLILVNPSSFKQGLGRLVRRFNQQQKVELGLSFHSEEEKTRIGRERIAIKEVHRVTRGAQPPSFI